MHERTTDAPQATIPLSEPPGRSYTPGASEQDRAMTSTEAGRLAGRPAASREPFGRAERLHLAVLAGLFVLLAAMLSAGAIAFSSLSGQILGLQEQMGGVHEEIGNLRAEMHEEIGELSERMARIETLIETHLVPASSARDPAGL
ncbi:MAG: hypothetical protein F4Y71_12245 [Acidobacteria bacterium]|nr:hypothetical protein [Acidobacteriota bacterium]